MKKNELLKVFEVSALSEISDTDIISLAERGEFGANTETSAHLSWAFQSQSAMADCIRKSFEMDKELVVSVNGDTEAGYGDFGGTGIEIKYI